MNTLDKIQVKKQELHNITEKLNNEIEKLNWQYLEDEYGLRKGNVCNVRGSYAELTRIISIIGNSIQLSFNIIKRNGEIGKNTTWGYAGEVIKEFESYKGYKQALEEL